jgi:hypothetical protein
MDAIQVQNCRKKLVFLLPQIIAKATCDALALAVIP